MNSNASLVVPDREKLTVFLRVLARLPASLLYGLATLLYYGLFRVARLRVRLVEEQLARAFPELGAASRAALVDAFLRQLADVLVEVVWGFAISPAELAERVTIGGAEALRERLQAGQSVLVLTAHHRNWEWLLLALSQQLQFPVEALYKPVKNGRVDAALRKMRARFGAHLVPAKDVLPAVVGRRAGARAIAMVADQVPTSSPHRIWTRFLNRDTAFYRGAELIAQAADLPVFFVAMYRLARGAYRVQVELLVDRPAGSEASREIMRRYAERLEALVRCDPSGWLWSHNRWKLPKPLYA